jgi:cholesterol oxidase
VSGLGPSVRPDAGGPVTAVIEDLDNPLGPTVVECFADWTRAGECGTVAGAGRSPVGGKGTFTYDPASDSVTLDWPAHDVTAQQGRRAVGAMLRRLIDAGAEGCIEADEVRSAMYGTAATASGRRSPTAMSTGDPLGGVPLGLATDDAGRVRPYSGLYVVDGALLPGHAACAGPALTIAAVVERNIEKIIEQDW